VIKRRTKTMASKLLDKFKKAAEAIDHKAMLERFSSLVKTNQERQYKEESMEEMCPYCGDNKDSLKKTIGVLREFRVACQTTDPEAFDDEMMRLCEEVRVLLMEVDE
jgi:hypothetical protein